MLRSSVQSRAVPQAPGAGPGQGGRRSSVPAPIIGGLAWLWRGLLWFWVTLLLSWLVAIFISVLVTEGQRAPSDLPVIRLALNYPWIVLAALGLAALLTCAARLAYRVRRPWSPYVLKRVGALAPHADRFIPRYLAPFYLYRVADPDAREALRLAANRTAGDEPLGICIVGPSMLGKTRLAWEAMQVELPDWTLAQWPLEGRPPFDLAALHGRRVVLWLDDLHKYAHLNLAATINDLPRRFAEAGLRFVIVATCRDGEEMALAAAALGPLLSRLVEIHPSEVSQDDAGWHAAALKYQGIKLQLDQFDGTPGSMLLAARRMRQEVYPSLPRSARRVLWAMRLLRSAGIYLYPLERVRAAVMDVFRLEPQEWQRACKALVRAGFVRVEALPGSKGYTLVPVADQYLDEVVPDYTVPGAHVSEGWPELEKSLAQRRDADALNQLGLAFLDLALGDPRANARHAEACFRAALEVYREQSAHAAWAIAQRNLGLAHWTQAQLTDGPERTTLLAQATAAYRLALRVGAWEGISQHCALAQQSLGAALTRWAALVEAEERSTLLAESVSAAHEALAVYQRAQALDDLVLTRQNLGAALSDQARLAAGPQRARLLAQAVDAYRAALAVSRHEETPVDWAITQNNLGLALMQQADLADEAARAALLREALACHTAALEMITRQETPAGWALTHVYLGSVYRRQAALAADAERAALLAQAVAAYRAALEVYTPQRAPDDWAMAQNNLGNALSDQALLCEGKDRLALLRQAIAAHQAALQVYTRLYAPVEWAGTHLNLAQVQLLRARSLKGGPREKVKPLAEAAQHAEHVLEVFTPHTAPAYHALAVQLEEEIRQASA